MAGEREKKLEKEKAGWGEKGSFRRSESPFFSQPNLQFARRERGKGEMRKGGEDVAGVFILDFFKEICYNEIIMMAPALFPVSIVRARTGKREREKKNWEEMEK